MLSILGYNGPTDRLSTPWLIPPVPTLSWYPRFDVLLPATCLILFSSGWLLRLTDRHCPRSRAPLPLRPPASARVNLVRKGVAVVLLAPLLWLGWPCAAPPPPLLRALRPIPNGVGVICDFFFFSSGYIVLVLVLRRCRSMHGGSFLDS